MPENGLGVFSAELQITANNVGEPLSCVKETCEYENLSPVNCNSAKSVVGSTLITFTDPLAFFGWACSSKNATNIVSAPWITCSAVSMSPSGERRTPVPDSPFEDV